MPVVRHYPGDTAPWTGVYALVGHFGKNTGFTRRVEAGQRLPTVTIPVEDPHGPYWFVYVSEAHKASAVA